MKKFEKQDYPSINESIVLSEDELRESLGGSCAKCKPSCKESCKPGSKTSDSEESESSEN